MDTATCKHCRKPIVRCDSVPSHAGCGSGYGWIHSNPEQWGHSCQPRSSAPYAQPLSDPVSERELKAMREHKCPRCHIPKLNRCRAEDGALLDHPHPERVKLVREEAERG